MVAPGLLVIEVHVSAGLNPPPVTATTVEAGPEVGVSPITGVVLVTVKVVVATSLPGWAVTITV